MNSDQNISVDRYSWERLAQANLVKGETPVVMTYVYEGRLLFSKAGWFLGKKISSSFPYAEELLVWDFVFDHYGTSQAHFLELAVLRVEQLPIILGLSDRGEPIAHLFTIAELNSPEIQSLNNDFKKWRSVGMPKRLGKRNF